VQWNITLGQNYPSARHAHQAAGILQIAKNKEWGGCYQYTTTKNCLQEYRLVVKIKVW